MQKCNPLKQAKVAAKSRQIHHQQQKSTKPPGLNSYLAPWRLSAAQSDTLFLSTFWRQGIVGRSCFQNLQVGIVKYLAHAKVKTSSWKNTCKRAVARTHLHSPRVVFHTPNRMSETSSTSFSRSWTLVCYWRHLIVNKAPNAERNNTKVSTWKFNCFENKHCWEQSRNKHTRMISLLAGLCMSAILFCLRGSIIWFWDWSWSAIVAQCNQFVPKQTVKQWKLCQRASTCANVPTMTSLRIKW